MTNFDRLKHQLHTLYALTIIQRGARLALRAFWLGIAGLLLAWSVNTLWRWLPNPFSWLLTGLVFALIPIAGFLFSLSSPFRWVQTLDQKMKFREEASTAWEISRAEQRGPINDLLVEDVLARMPKAREHMLRDGWYREIDLAATLITLVLACALFLFLLLSPKHHITGSTPTNSAPSIAQQQDSGQNPSNAQPGQQGQQPGGQSPESGQNQNGQSPGSQPQNSLPKNGQPQNGQPDQNHGGSASPDMGAVGEALRNLGSQLSQQAGTYDLGQALQNMDLQGAANKLGDLSGQLNDISPQTRDNLSQSLGNAANSVGQAGAQALSQDMGSAAGALSGSNNDAGQALGNVARDLRQLGNNMQASGGRGTGTQKGNSTNTGNPEPLSRLNQDGGELKLPIKPDNAQQSNLLGPASSDATGDGIANGSLDSTNQSGGNAVQSPLLPNTLLWKWRDVISQYFQR